MEQIHQFLDTEDGSLYKFNKNLLHKTLANDPINRPNSGVYSATEKMEFFAHTFKEQFPPNPTLDFLEISDRRNLVSLLF